MMHVFAPRQPPTCPTTEVFLSLRTHALQALVGRNFAHHPNLVQASAQMQG